MLTNDPSLRHARHPATASPLIEINVFGRNPALYIRRVHKRNMNDDQVDDGTANVGSWHGNRNDGNRSAGLVGWL
jgi:hypothetical protein